MYFSEIEIYHNNIPIQNNKSENCQTIPNRASTVLYTLRLDRKIETNFTVFKTNITFNIYLNIAAKNYEISNIYCVMIMRKEKDRPQTSFASHVNTGLCRFGHVIPAIKTIMTQSR